MADERVTERVDAAGNVERTTERDTGGTTVVEGRGGGSGLLIGAILLIGIAILAYFLLNMNNQEARQTDAIEGAAGAVADGAKDVGDAAGAAVDKLDN